MFCASFYLSICVWNFHQHPAFSCRQVCRLYSGIQALDCAGVDWSGLRNLLYSQQSPTLAAQIDDAPPNALVFCDPLKTSV